MPSPGVILHPLSFDQLLVGLVSHHKRQLEEICRLSDENRRLCVEYARHTPDPETLELAVHREDSTESTKVDGFSSSPEQAQSDVDFARRADIAMRTRSSERGISSESSMKVLSSLKSDKRSGMGSRAPSEFRAVALGNGVGRHRQLSFEDLDQANEIELPADDSASLVPTIKVLENGLTPLSPIKERCPTIALEAARGDDGGAVHGISQEIWNLPGKDIAVPVSVEDGIVSRPPIIAVASEKKSNKPSTISSIRVASVGEGESSEHWSRASLVQSSGNRGSSALRSSYMKHFTQESTLGTSAGMRDEHGVYPHWFNPRGRVPYLAGLGSAASLVSDGQRQPLPFCYLSPKGPTRFIWDLFWCIMLGYEMWLVPLDLIFLADAETPTAFKVISWVVTFFFTVDICLNFITGYVENDVEVTSMRRIVTNYMQTWFAIDVIATIPWSDIFSNSDSGASSSLRVGKATKAVKIIKISRLLRGLKMFRRMKVMKKLIQFWTEESLKKENKGDFFTWLFHKLNHFLMWFFQSSATPLTILIKLTLLAHVVGLGYGWARGDESGTEYGSGEEAFEAGMEDYYASLWWAFSLVTFGTNVTQSRSYILSTFYLFALWGRLCLAAGLVSVIVGHALYTHADDAGESIRRSDALEYMDSHNVRDETRNQALNNAKANRDLQKIQANFNYFLNNQLPHELARTVREELWSTHLLSLGLLFELSGWNKDFIPDLAQLVQEESYASGVIVFREGDAAIVAYMVARGKIRVVDSTRPEKSIPPFTDGMWFGEKALVNPELRRGGSAITEKRSDLMTVASADFFALIEKHDLKVDYQQFCVTELWKGLCGRCGALGDHWSDECEHPTRRKAGSGFRSGSYNRYSHVSYFSASGSETGELDITGKHFMRDLKLFVDKHHLQPLVPLLARVEVGCLDDLLDPDKREALFNDEEASAYMKELGHLSLDSINNFKRHILGAARGVLQLRVAAGSHYMFLSHYKVEAGTEAALMRSELEQMISESEAHAAQRLKVPIFLDSEDLTSLFELMEAVRKSHNVVLLLTKGVLTRPWCLVEIVTAMKENIAIIPVNIMKVGCEFEFPDSKFYDELMDGTILGESGLELLNEHDIDMSDVVDAVQMTLKRIAIPYSPHRPLAIRRTELQGLMKLSKMRDMNAHAANQRGRGSITAHAQQRQSSNYGSAPRRGSIHGGLF